MSNLWGREPAMILSTVQAALALAMAYGLRMTADQMALWLTLSGMLLGLITRTQVTPIRRGDDR